MLGHIYGPVRATKGNFHEIEWVVVIYLADGYAAYAVPTWQLWGSTCMTV